MDDANWRFISICKMSCTGTGGIDDANKTYAGHVNKTAISFSFADKLSVSYLPIAESAIGT